MNAVQNKIMHALLSQTGLMNQKSNLIIGATGGRSESSKDMTFDEARDLITWLRSLPNHEAEGANRMRRSIISMAHEMGWHTLIEGHWVADLTRINAWMLKSSYLHKRLNAYKYKELPKLITQFEFVYKSFLKKI